MLVLQTDAEHCVRQCFTDRALDLDDTFLLSHVLHLRCARLQASARAVHPRRRRLEYPTSVGRMKPGGDVSGCPPGRNPGVPREFRRNSPGHGAPQRQPAINTTGFEHRSEIHPRQS
ncbi:hypothetical protein ACFFX0_10840 [Citricoccus parietis]|uniref:PIN domain-containing protein n=1 Tax=Citricoccus parietis TaxID=592307 RepID=A0ABV5FYA3_9MICC